MSSKYDYPIVYIADDIDKIFNWTTGTMSIDIDSIDYDIKALEKKLNKQ